MATKCENGLTVPTSLKSTGNTSSNTISNEMTDKGTK